jgi:hypothetical protein
MINGERMRVCYACKRPYEIEDMRFTTIRALHLNPRWYCTACHDEHVKSCVVCGFHSGCRPMTKYRGFKVHTKCLALMGVCYGCRLRYTKLYPAWLREFSTNTQRYCLMCCNRGRKQPQRLDYPAWEYETDRMPEQKAPISWIGDECD